MSKMTRVLSYSMGLFLFVAVSVAQNTVTVPEQVVAYPSTIVYNGKIVTMDDAGVNQSTGTVVEAMAVRDGKILALGKTAEILRYAGPKTQKIDAKGRTVIPGIINTHHHMYGTASGIYFRQHPEALEGIIKTVSVSGRSETEMRQGIERVLKEQLPTLKPGQWLRISLPTGGSAGTGIGIKFIQTEGMPRRELDRLAPQTPVVLAAKFSVINSAAAKAYEAENGFPVATLKPNGFAEDSVGPNLVESYFSSRVDVLADVLEKEVLAKHAALGTTTWASRIMLEKSPWSALKKLASEGRMPNRLAYSIARSDRDVPDPSEFFKSLPDMDNFGNDYLWMMGVGTQSLDSGPPGICTTMEAPKAVKDREICRILPGNAYAKAVYAAIRSQQRLAVGHIYGDKALDYFFDEIERARKDDPSITLDYIRSRKFTSDHCGFYPRPAQIEQIVKYNMILSCGPRYLDRSAPWLADYGNFYATWIVPLKTILAGGAKVVYEDSGVSPEVGSGLTYFRAVPYAVTRKNGKGELVGASEAVDRVTVMKMMTTWAAEFVGRPELLGTLEKGKWADFVVLNKDYFTVPVEEIPTVFPLLTVTGGRIVVLRNEYAQELGLQPAGPQIDFTFKDAPGFREAD